MCSNVDSQNPAPAAVNFNHSFFYIMLMTSEVKMKLTLDTLERHRGERARLFLARSAGNGEEAEEASALVELRQDLWNCVRTYTIYVRVSSW